jgi:hypothetical protein
MRYSLLMLCSCVFLWAGCHFVDVSTRETKGDATSFSHCVALDVIYDARDAMANAACDNQSNSKRVQP